MIPEGFSCKDAYEEFYFIQFFENSKETMEEINGQDEARRPFVDLEKLKRVPDHRKLVVPYTIYEVETPVLKDKGVHLAANFEVSYDPLPAADPQKG